MSHGVPPAGPAPGVGAPDLTVELAGLASALRRAEVTVPAGAVAAAVEALASLGPHDRGSAYWAARLTMCSRPDDHPVFDEVFALWFDRSAWAGSVHRAVVPTEYRDVPEAAPETGGEEQARSAPPTASRTEVLRRRDVAALDDDERALVHDLVRRLRQRPALRRSRRARRASSGRVDLARMVRRAVRTGGEPLHWEHRRAAVRARRVVLLLDVSGSMRRYAETYLLFGHALVQARADAEVFSLGTRLTCLTRPLRTVDPQRAADEAAAMIPDWSGGTRLGAQLEEFVDRWGRRGMARGAVVVVLSDGWERGDAGLLGEQMSRLNRLAHRVVWVNPNRARPGFEPLTAGLQAALPHVDAFVDGHCLASLEELTDQIGRGSRRA